MFGRATITLGIDPHSSFLLFCLQLHIEACDIYQYTVQCHVLFSILI